MRQHNGPPCADTITLAAAEFDPLQYFLYAANTTDGALRLLHAGDHKRRGSLSTTVLLLNAFDDAGMGYLHAAMVCI